MRNIVRRRCVVLGLVVMTVGLWTGPPAKAEGPDVWAIRNARIVPVSGPVIERGTVVVRGGLIVDVGANVQPPADARLVEGAGLTVYPGLIDANLPVEAEKK